MISTSKGLFPLRQHCLFSLLITKNIMLFSPCLLISKMCIGYPENNKLLFFNYFLYRHLKIKNSAAIL